PDGLFVIKRAQVLALLQPLPVRKVPGVGKVMQSRLAALGVPTVGDLARFSAAELEHHFGRYGLRLHELSPGVDTRPVPAAAPLQQISAETTFATDLRLDALDETLARLAVKVWEQGTRKGAIGRTVVLKLKTDRFRILTRTLTRARPVESAA